MEPGIIKKLDETVVNRIAAGEIIKRPANALKELIENSLDAKSTQIQVVVKSGGLKFLQIQDNGTGIRKDNLEIVCERFTTSKLSTYEDLSTISTYGFRGEALASISHVSRLTIQTKTGTESCAYRGCYEDGRLKDKLKPCAGNQGTTITIEDLFFNVHQRRQGLKNTNEEYQKIVEVISKYAVHNPSVGFTLKKSGESIHIRTPPSSSIKENIGLIYGKEIAKDLIDLELTEPMLKFQLTGYISNLNYQSKKMTMLLFINHRLVESANLKSAIDFIYSSCGNNSQPFIYISLDIDPRSVDVNVHPTKHEVHFLHETEIIERIKCCVEEKLLGNGLTKRTYTQSRLPGFEGKEDKDVTTGPIHPKDVVRTDSKERKLETFFGMATLQPNYRFDQNDPMLSQSFQMSTECKAVKKEMKLTSVLNLQKSVENQCSRDVRLMVQDLTFVGCVSPKYSLIQYHTDLYICNTEKLCSDLFYQLLLYDFENFGQINVTPGLPIKQLALLALDHRDCGWTETDGSKEELADRVSEILLSKSMMLKEYFQLIISDDGNIIGLPLLLRNHQPAIVHLPMYILRLATEVEWDREQECFDTFCRETAEYYSKFDGGNSDWKWTVEHLIYPAIKRYLMPNRQCLMDKSIIRVTSLPDLYKVFERC